MRSSIPATRSYSNPPDGPPPSSRRCTVRHIRVSASKPPKRSRALTPTLFDRGGILPARAGPPVSWLDNCLYAGRAIISALSISRRMRCPIERGADTTARPCILTRSSNGGLWALTPDPDPGYDSLSAPSQVHAPPLSTPPTTQPYRTEQGMHSWVRTSRCCLGTSVFDWMQRSTDCFAQLLQPGLEPGMAWDGGFAFGLQHLGDREVQECLQRQWLK